MSLIWEFLIFTFASAFVFSSVAAEAVLSAVPRGSLACSLRCRFKLDEIANALRQTKYVRAVPEKAE